MKVRTFITGSDPFGDGMDRHSSGITTSAMGAFKRGLNPRPGDLGLYIRGGRGRGTGGWSGGSAERREWDADARGIAEMGAVDGRDWR